MSSGTVVCVKLNLSSTFTLVPKPGKGTGKSSCIHARKITLSNRKGEVCVLYRDLMIKRNRLLHKTAQCRLSDLSLSTINKHVLLRSYLDGEPKLLVDSIAVLAYTYEDT
jgi:hypothetical protein